MSTPPKRWKRKLAGAIEGQAILGVSHGRWYQLASRPGFPEPFDYLRSGAVWSVAELEAYQRTRPRGATVEAESA